MISPLQLGQVIQAGYDGKPVALEGFSLVDVVLMKPQWLFWKETLVTGYLFANDSGVAALVFLGTQDAIQWALNFDSDPVDFAVGNSEPMALEHGFVKMYCSCWLRDSNESLDDWLTLYAPQYLHIAGHSLGGALACVAALTARTTDHLVRLVTFGCPRVGDLAFATRLGAAIEPESMIIRNVHDLVPLTPPWLHGVRGHLITFDSDELGVPDDPASRHKMPCYLAEASRLSGVAGGW